MLSKKIELPANDMAEALELAKQNDLELVFEQISCENCVAKVLFKDTRKGYQSLLKLVQGIHVLEVKQIERAMRFANVKNKLKLELLTSKKQKV